MKSYRVTAGYVTVETGPLGAGRAFRDVQQGAVLPADVPEEQIEHELRLGTIELVETTADPTPAPPADEPPPLAPNPDAMPAGMSVPTTLEWVGGDLVRAREALDAEVAGLNRATLVKRLEEKLAGADASNGAGASVDS